MRANYLYYTLIIFTTGALCLQRGFKIAGGIGWGVAIAISLYFLWQRYQNGELQKLLQKEALYTKHLKMLGILAVVMLWGVLFTDNIGSSLSAYGDNWWYKTFPFFISGLVIRDIRCLRIILACFGMALSIDCYVAAYQFLVLGKIAWGFSGHHNYLASIVTIVIPMLMVLLLDKDFSKKDKVFALFMLINCLIGAVCTVSRGCWLALAVVVPFVILPYILKNKKLLLVIVIMTLCVGGVFSNSNYLLEKFKSTNNVENNYSNIGRFHMWNISMYMVKDHPFGIGAGRFADTYLRDYDHIYGTPKDAQHLRHPHNMFIKIWVEYGPLGLVTYTYVCMLLFYYNIKQWLKNKSPYMLMILGGWMAFMIYGIFEIIGEFSATAKIWWFLLGALLIMETSSLNGVEGERP